MKTQDLRFRFLMNKADGYITSACRSFSGHFRHLTQDDLRQECLIKLDRVIKRYPDRDDDEILLLYKSSIYNLLRDIYNKQRGSVTFESIQEEQDFAADEQDDVLFEQYCVQVRNRLNGVRADLFDLMLVPDRKLMKLANKRACAVTFRTRDYAKRLGVSPATVSRAMTEIRSAVLTVL